MALGVDLIYCAGGNPRFYAIARDAGFLYGVQLPDTVYGPLHFADQDWKAPDRARYMAALAQHRPHMATVLDWEREAQLSEVLNWAEEAAQFVNVVVIVPKVIGGIGRIPARIGGADVRLGYSVPTRYGGTDVPIWEFGARPVHLLGGSPQRQMQYALHGLNVQSADGNYAQRMALTSCQFWEPGTAHYARNRYWPRLEEADGSAWGQDAPYEAFRRSCRNIARAWRGGGAGIPGLGGGSRERSVR